MLATDQFQNPDLGASAGQTLPNMMTAPRSSHFLTVPMGDIVSNQDISPAHNMSMDRVLFPSSSIADAGSSDVKPFGVKKEATASPMQFSISAAQNSFQTSQPTANSFQSLSMSVPGGQMQIPSNNMASMQLLAPPPASTSSGSQLTLSQATLSSFLQQQVPQPSASSSAPTQHNTTTQPSKTTRVPPTSASWRERVAFHQATYQRTSRTTAS